MIVFRSNFLSFTVIISSLLFTSALVTTNDVSMSTSRSALHASFLEAFFDSRPTGARATPAREIMKVLVDEKKCFSTVDGAKSFGAACADDVVYEDLFEPEPFVGVDVSEGK